MKRFDRLLAGRSGPDQGREVYPFWRAPAVEFFAVKRGFGEYYPDETLIRHLIDRSILSGLRSMSGI